LNTQCSHGDCSLIFVITAKTAYKAKKYCPQVGLGRSLTAFRPRDVQHVQQGLTFTSFWQV
jgi:hypothetical protein